MGILPDPAYHPLHLTQYGCRSLHTVNNPRVEGTRRASWLLMDAGLLAGAPIPFEKENNCYLNSLGSSAAVAASHPLQVRTIGFRSVKE